MSEVKLNGEITAAIIAAAMFGFWFLATHADEFWALVAELLGG